MKIKGNSMTSTNQLNPWLLTRMILDYWGTRLTAPEESVTWSNQGDEEGLFWYNGYNATFWYLLNVEWYRMQDKLLAKTGCSDPFDYTLRDFDADHLDRYRR